MNLDTNNAGQVWARSKQFYNLLEWSYFSIEQHTLYGSHKTNLVPRSHSVLHCKVRISLSLAVGDLGTRLSQDYREPIVIHHASMYDYSA